MTNEEMTFQERVDAIGALARALVHLIDRDVPRTPDGLVVFRLPATEWDAFVAAAVAGGRAMAAEMADHRAALDAEWPRIQATIARYNATMKAQRDEQD